MKNKIPEGKVQGTKPSLRAPNEKEIQLYKDSVDFLRSLPQYKDVDFKAVLKDYKIVINDQYTKSWHRGDKKIIEIAYTDESRLHYYSRRVVGVFTKPAGLKAPIDFTVKSYMVHEITHAIQIFESRKPTEIETTKNEYTLLMAEQPELNKQLLKYKKRSFIDGQTVIFNDVKYTIRQAFLKPLNNYSIFYYSLNLIGESKYMAKVPENLITAADEK